MLGKKKLAVLVAAVFLVAALASPLAAYDQSAMEETEPSTAAVVGDLVLVRPVGVVSMVVGSALFVGTLPFSVWGGKKDIGRTADKLVVEPTLFTFDRPVGEFDDGH
jgi:hypothetical protein